MPVEKSQQLTLKNWPEPGVNTNLTPETELVGETTLRIACDSSTCKNTIQWVLETAGDNAEGVPDDAWRVLILEQFGGQKNVFCSQDCLRRWLKNYIPPLSPKEKAQIEAHNAALTPTIPVSNVITVPIPEVPGISESEYVEAIKEESVAISQPDGFAEEGN